MEDYIIEPNFEHAVKYYSIAKKDEFPRALNNLGAMYVRLGDKLS
jgi:TPR repeat protein